MAAAAILKISFLATTHRPIVRFRQNFVCGGITVCRQRPHDKNCMFSKSKKAAILKIVKLPYTSENIVGF